MQTIYFIGVSVFLYGFVAGYFAYSAFQKSTNPLHKIRRLVAALLIGFVAILLGWLGIH
jgi:fluoride ion exporter CrcB/FEX